MEQAVGVTYCCGYCKPAPTFAELSEPEQREVYVRTADEMIRIAKVIAAWAKSGH